MMRRLLAAAVALTLVVSIVAAASASPKGPPPAASPPPAGKVDRNRNKVLDDLDARQAGRPASEREDVIVVLNVPASADRVGGFERTVGPFAIRRRFEVIDGFAAAMTKQQVLALATDPRVEHIEADSTAHALNDTSEQSFGVAGARMDAPGLDGNADGNVSVYSEDDLVAAVIDTGIDAAHQDLDEGKVIGFKDFVNGATTPYDDNGHGTHVSATIAGDGDARPDRLYQGVAPAAALVGVKVLDRRGNGSESGVVSGIDWVVQNKATYGIEAINLSLGIAGCSSGTDATSLAVDRAADAGIVVSVAAGNEGPGTCTVGSPGAAAKALTVGAMADLGPNGFFQANFSSRGKTFDGRIKPDVSGPGVDITSAQAGTTGGYVNESGTSMATPFLAGVALLMLDANQALTPTQVKDKIMQTAIDWGRGGDNKTAGSTGQDIDYGAGRLDAYAAIRSAGAHIGTPPPAPKHQLFQGTLSGTGTQVDYPIQVTNIGYPIAATMIMPAISAATAVNPDFDLYLYSPTGAEVARSYTYSRQEQLGYHPTTTGTYTLRVVSFNGSGGYFVDLSSAPTPPPYEAPHSASLLNVSLVPVFRECGTGGNAVNASHAAPLSVGSCAPPRSAAGVTAHLGVQSVSSARIAAVPGDLTTAADEADMSFAVDLTDVRAGSVTGTDYNPSAGSDLTLATRLRITDRSNGASGTDAATTTDFDFSVPVSCAPTADPAMGSTCLAATTADAVQPGAVREGRQAVLQIFRLRLTDSGANGVRGDSDDRLFAQQGVFVP
jgi:serine protease AprX